MPYYDPYCECNDYIQGTPCAGQTGPYEILWSKTEDITAEANIYRYKNKCYSFPYPPGDGVCPSGGHIVTPVSTYEDCDDCVYARFCFPDGTDSILIEDGSCSGIGNPFGGYGFPTKPTEDYLGNVYPAVAPHCWKSDGSCSGCCIMQESYVGESYFNQRIPNMTWQDCYNDPNSLFWTNNPAICQPRGCDCSSVVTGWCGCHCTIRCSSHCGCYSPEPTPGSGIYSYIIPATICGNQSTPIDLKPIYALADELENETDVFIFRHDDICYSLDPLGYRIPVHPLRLSGYDIVSPERNFETCDDCIVGINASPCSGVYPYEPVDIFVPEACLASVAGAFRYKGVCYFVDPSGTLETRNSGADIVCNCDNEFATCSDCKCGTRLTAIYGKRARACYGFQSVASDVWIADCALPDKTIVFKHQGVCYVLPYNQPIVEVPNGAVLAYSFSVYKNCALCRGYIGGVDGDPDEPDPDPDEPFPPGEPPPEPPPDPTSNPGTCCFPNYSCLNITQNQCYELGGSYISDETDCDLCPGPGDPPVPPLPPNPPDPPDDPTDPPDDSETGSCCFSDGDCLPIDEGLCNFLQGTWTSGQPCSMCPPQPPDCVPMPCPEEPEKDSLAVRYCGTNAVAGAVKKSSGVAGKTILWDGNCARVTASGTTGGIDYTGKSYYSCSSCAAEQDYYELLPCDPETGDLNLYSKVNKWIQCFGGTDRVLYIEDGDCYTKGDRVPGPLPSGSVEVDFVCLDYRSSCDDEDCQPRPPCDGTCESNDSPEYIDVEIAGNTMLSLGYVDGVCDCVNCFRHILAEDADVNGTYRLTKYQSDGCVWFGDTEVSFNSVMESLPGCGPPNPIDYKILRWELSYSEAAQQWSIRGQLGHYEPTDPDPYPNNFQGGFQVFFGNIDPVDFFGNHVITDDATNDWCGLTCEAGEGGTATFTVSDNCIEEPP